MVDTLQLDADAPVTVAGDQRPLRQWLTERRELTQLTRPFLAAHAERADSAELRALLQPASRDAFTAYTKQAQVLDVLHRYRTTWTAEALVNALRPLTPRLYSIASSQALVGDEVHITVAHVNYRRDGEARWGTTSRYLADRDTSQSVPVFIEANERFHLPDDDDRDIIMIGPGTGVAPFRAFVQERTERGASGRNWLLFGNPHFHADFLYQVEWQKALKSGRLHRLDLAFSRDQPNKIYVQHRLREQGRRLYEWLDGGAHVYVCGDASAMARDVHAALIDVVVEHSGRSTPDAEAWLNELIQQGRYARDVY
jgi:sulfite reductase (NADPH) flavoprotein alpha-component